MLNKRAFKERVDIERQVLSLVNGSQISQAELAGLSIPAINKWAESTLLQAPALQNLSYVKHLLVEITQRLRLNSDKSRDVFEDDELIPRNTIETCLIQLKNALD